MVEASIRPLALTSWSVDVSSVRIPYLAGEYAAAPAPTRPYMRKGFRPTHIPKDPISFTPLAISMTAPFERESAKGPTKGASKMYAPTKNSWSSGAVQDG